MLLYLHHQKLSPIRFSPKEALAVQSPLAKMLTLNLLYQCIHTSLQKRHCCLTNRVHYLVCHILYTRRAEISVDFMSVQRWVLDGSSTRLAHLVTITSYIYTVQSVSATH